MAGRDLEEEEAAEAQDAIDAPTSARHGIARFARSTAEARSLYNQGAGLGIRARLAALRQMTVDSVVPLPFPRMGSTMSTPHEHARWQAARRRSVTAPTGNLALIETRWTGGPADRRRTPSRAGISRGDPDPARRPRHRRRPARPAGVGCHIPRPSFVRPHRLLRVRPCMGRLRTFRARRRGPHVPFEHIRDNGGTRELVVPGDIRVTVHGRDYTLAAFDDGGTAFARLRATRPTAPRPMAPGAYLYVQREGGCDCRRARRRHPGLQPRLRAALRILREYNCPTASRREPFPLPIRAGEKHLVFRDGFDSTQRDPPHPQHPWSTTDEEISHRRVSGCRRSPRSSPAARRRRRGHRRRDPPTTPPSTSARSTSRRTSQHRRRRPGRHRGVQRRRVRGALQAHR